MVLMGWLMEGWRTTVPWWLLVMSLLIALVAHRHILLLLLGWPSAARHVLLMLLMLGHSWLVIRVGNPDNQVLASANKHAVYMAKFECSYCRRMEVK